MERKRKKTEIQKIYNTNAKHSSLDTPLSLCYIWQTCNLLYIFKKLHRYRFC